MTVYFNLHMTPSKKKVLDFEGGPTLDGESGMYPRNSYIKLVDLLLI